MIAWLPVKPFGVFWYFYTLSQLYLVFSAQRVHAIPPKRMLPLLLVVGLISTNWIPASIWFHFRSLCYYSFFFYLGILLCDRGEYWIFKKEAVWTAATAAFILCVLYWSPDHTINNIPTVNMFVGIGFTMLLFWGFRRFSVIGNCAVLQYIGRHTLEIYLFHTYFTSGFRQIDRLLKLDNVYLSIIINSSIGLVASICIAWVLKKLKLSTLVLKPMALFNSK